MGDLLVSLLPEMPGLVVTPAAIAGCVLLLAALLGFLVRGVRSPALS
jgi:hypothetical protein